MIMIGGDPMKKLYKILLFLTIGLAAFLLLWHLNGAPGFTPEMAMEKLLHQPERTPDWHRERAEWLREHMTWRVRMNYFEQVYSELVQQDR